MYLRTRRKSVICPILVLFAFVSSLPCAKAEQWYGRVVSVRDGDTLEVLLDGRAERLRLHGIDSPELGQAFGRHAKEFTSEVAFGKTVRVLPRDTDRYGRTVAEVILPDGRNLNHEIVRAGFAWRYRQYAPTDTTLSRLESEANAARRGLWADADPVPPWEWRRNQNPRDRMKRSERRDQARRASGR